ncbi:UDP-N-acetylmuramoyl-tripeptide--D-alanyl-D-alanine ligase [Anaerobacillus sp. 1_MG-2023]|uniref:Mur ligase family protein n=1 Tax=Anaerobacillus sp. 1_MG-2023 TaxID=3062655 RepID=UPI0026E425C6|nr:UDP-N-acetylmuramoyl-tripeptide--D-alanyl-D-alanine ligase [Anaerobacillus sp. 1_MG-2023]MDO6654553.1 UDP-N-acetylmuramoyl-tripeptide--D-alanyl-D-alanine ligase [Anaerobacillus sp. 1_MG-2023]
MKHLPLPRLLPVLEGTVLSGSTAKTVKNAAKYGEHLITDQSLVFMLKRKSSMPLPDKAKNIMVVTSNPKALKNVKEDVTVIYVEDVRKAYYRFISFYRGLFQLPVIGVTGTCGKTTTKEMITWILKERDRVVSTKLSHNGLARNLDYLLEIDDATDSAVFEMGVSGSNQLLYSAHYFRPQIGIITAIGTDHIEGFLSQDAYIAEKAKMLKAVGKNGTILLNGDDETIRNLDLITGKVLYYGQDSSAHFRARSIRFNLQKNGMDFILVCREGEFSCFVPGYGTHNVFNALAAIAASSLVGVKIPDAIRRLKSFHHVKSHLQFHEGRKGSLLIDDTWNTNPTSIEAALEVLIETAQGRKTVAVLGEMEELGHYAEQEHRKVGALVAKKDVDVLIAVGKNAYPICSEAAKLGMNPSAIHNVTTQSQLLTLLDQFASPQTSILLKTSMRRSFSDTLQSLVVKSKRN